MDSPQPVATSRSRSTATGVTRTSAWGEKGALANPRSLRRCSSRTRSKRNTEAIEIGNSPGGGADHRLSRLAMTLLLDKAREQVLLYVA